MPIRTRFPLYARILLWFFVNLVVLFLAFVVFMRVQFHSRFDWMLAAGADQRLQTLSELITIELGDRPESEWDEVLRNFSERYRLRFHLLDNSDGSSLAGETVVLPAPVRAQIPGYRSFAPRPSRGPFRSDRPTFEGRMSDRPVSPPSQQRDNTKYIIRTDDPTQYWALVRVAIRGSEHRYTIPATLAIVSDTLTAGGLFFNYKPWLAVGLGAVLLSALLWIPFVRSLTRSIAQMTYATGRIADGRFDERVQSRRSDELGTLANSINSMAGRLSGFVAGQKRFLGDIAHELCAPIARIQMALGVLEDRCDERNRSYVQDLQEDVEHMSSLVNELLSFSKAAVGSAPLELVPVNLLKVAEEAAKREDGGRGRITVKIPPHLRAMAAPDMLLRALSNLLRNSIRYAGEAGPISVTAWADGKKVFLVIADNGPGVPETELAKIFDPFYRIDASRNAATGGVGLGLAIVKTCVDACEGTISCKNKVPSGLETTITLAAPKD